MQRDALKANEREVLDFLKGNGTSRIDDIADNVELDQDVNAAEINAALVMLEIKGYATRGAGNYFTAIQEV